MAMLPGGQTEPPNLVIYSEKDLYYLYFQDYLEYILEHSELKIAYLTSDPEDPLFDLGHPRVQVRYIKHFLPVLVRNLEAGALLMTMPDLDTFQVKRSSRSIRHVYLFHALVSTHLQYREGAFDAFDDILCVGPHQETEIRRREQQLGLRRKNLVPAGYARVDRIRREDASFAKARVQNPGGLTSVLVAPTWGEGSLLESCIFELIEILGSLPCRAQIRPHPQFVRTRPKQLEEIKRAASRQPNIRVEMDLASDLSLHTADVLITDRSGIAYEFAFGTERPVLFIDTPLKIQNPKYEELGVVPMEIASRDLIGKSLAPRELHHLPEVLNAFWQDQESFRASIRSYRSQILYHPEDSAAKVGEFLIGICTPPGKPPLPTD